MSTVLVRDYYWSSLNEYISEGLTALRNDETITSTSPHHSLFRWEKF